MKIYSDTDGKGDSVIVLNKVEGRLLVAALEQSMSVSKKNTGVHIFAKKLSETLEVF